MSKKNKSKLKKCTACGKEYNRMGLMYRLYATTCSLACWNNSPHLKQSLNLNNVQPTVVPEGMSGKVASRRNRKRSKANNVSNDFYKSDAWLDLRYRVIKKYGRECMACGETKGSMHVDHIIPRSKARYLELSFDNMQVLCKACNLGKLNRDSTDFRPDKTQLLDSGKHYGNI